MCITELITSCNCHVNMISIHEVDVSKLCGSSLVTLTTKTVKPMFLIPDLSIIVASLKEKVIDFPLKSRITTTRKELF